MYSHITLTPWQQIFRMIIYHLGPDLLSWTVTNALLVTTLYKPSSYGCCFFGYRTYHRPGDGPESKMKPSLRYWLSCKGLLCDFAQVLWFFLNLLSMSHADLSLYVLGIPSRLKRGATILFFRSHGSCLHRFGRILQTGRGVTKGGIFNFIMALVTDYLQVYWRMPSMALFSF